MNLSRVSRAVRILRDQHRSTSNLANAKSTVTLWLDDHTLPGQKYIRRREQEFAVDGRGHLICTIGEFNAGGVLGTSKHGCSVYWGPDNPLNYVDNIRFSPLGVTLKSKYSWEECDRLTLQYSREMNMRAIKHAAETAKFLGIDCLTITLQNFKLINQFNSIDAAGSLMHSFKNNMKNVVKTNWYHMLSLAGLKVFLCRLEYQDAAARELAIQAANASKFKPRSTSQELVSDEHKQMDQAFKQYLSQVRVNGSADNIDYVRGLVRENRRFVLTRQVSADQNKQLLADHRRSVGLPVIPQHNFVEANVDMDWEDAQSFSLDEDDEFDALEKIFMEEKSRSNLSDEELLNTLDG